MRFAVMTGLFLFVAGGMTALALIILNTAYVTRVDDFYILFAGGCSFLGAGVLMIAMAVEVWRELS